ncbi:serine/threonine-protein kinase [Myxococcota bacterium]
MELSQPSTRHRVGQVIGNRWTLKQIIGQGATAAVYAACDVLGQRAAVRILSSEVTQSPQLGKRLARALAAVQDLEHPAVVKVLDYDVTHPELAYVATELLQGETLTERLQRQDVTPLPDVLRWMDQLLEALAAAHAEGLVHRHLKPSSLFLTQDGQLKMLDLGVAHLLEPLPDGTATQIRPALGTAGYLPPELAQGRHDWVDERTDLFAAGAILFRWLAGRCVHRGRTESEMLASAARVPPPSLASVNASVPAEVARVVDISLSFSRDARYSDALAMLQDIRALRQGVPPPLATLWFNARELATLMPRSHSKPPPEPTPPPPSETERLIGTVLAGRYRLAQLLGAGGMGSVYRAEHVHMRKAVAIKVLHRDMTALPEMVARFEREAIASARIEHPNVAGATDFGQLDDGSFFLVLEFVEGQSLRWVLEREGPLPPPRAAEIARQIASALAAAHGAHIVHRDLKPENVMLVSRGDGVDWIKVLDFGIAKVTVEELRDQPALTQYGSVFGTPEYMAPEQALGQTVDHRADLYALGIVLYEMLQARTPFADDDLVAVLTRQMTATGPQCWASGSLAIQKATTARWPGTAGVGRHRGSAPIQGAERTSFHGRGGCESPGQCLPCDGDAPCTAGVRRHQYGSGP